MATAKFFRRYAAFVALGIEPDRRSWSELEPLIAEAKAQDLVARGVKRFTAMTSKQVMDWTTHATKNGIKDFPKAGEFPDGVEGPADAKQSGPARRPTDPRTARNKAAAAKPKAQGDAADFLRAVKARLNGRAAATA